MNIKMIAVDLDGTLFTEAKTVTPRTLSALAKCREMGIKVVFATGRGPSSGALLPVEHFDGYAVNNGAQVYVDGELVYDKVLPHAAYGGLIAALCQAGVRCAIVAKGKHVMNFDAPAEWEGFIYTRVTDAEFMAITADAEKVWAVADSPEVVSLIREYVTEEMFLYIARDDFALMSHRDAIKSKALAALAERWGIDSEEIVVFGDDMNDLCMFAYAGTAVAMGNALDEVKAAADMVCGTNEEDGIAVWIETHVLG